MKSGTDDDGNVSDDFAEFLADFAYGSVNDQASEKLREVISACKKTGSKGSLALKLSVAVKGEMASLAFKISTSKPEPELPGTILFATEDGALAKSDPRQLKLPSKVLESPPTNIRTIKEHTP